MTAYYNEFDPYAAQWLRNLIAAGHIAPGVVDERSITEVHPDELRGYTQCHFFAGIGVWSHSLRAAGWDDARPVWTGSCPCQPFSSAGKRLGVNDERHLWPHLFRLIQACRPVTVFGEQVASSDGLKWLDLVQTDLEGAGYASGAVDTCAAGHGAPHIRQRLYWVAHSMPAGRTQRWTGTGNGPIAGSSEPDGLAHAKVIGHGEHQRNTGAVERPTGCHEGQEPQVGRPAQAVGDSCENGGVADTHQFISAQPANGQRQEADQRSADCGQIGGVVNPLRFGQQGTQHVPGGQQPIEPQPGLEQGVSAKGATCRMADPIGERGRCGQPGSQDAGDAGQPIQAGNGSPTHGFWGAADWLYCRDARWRPVEPSTFPLAHGATSRVGRLRAYGNALCAPVAEAFIRAYLTE